MITNVNIYLTVVLALFQSVSRVWCMTIQQKRPFKTMGGKMEAMASRTLREATSSAEEETTTSEIVPFQRTEVLSEIESTEHHSESVLMEDRTYETTYSEEADNAGRTFVDSYSSSLPSISIEGGTDVMSDVKLTEPHSESIFIEDQTYETSNSEEANNAERTLMGSSGSSLPSMSNEGGTEVMSEVESTEHHSESVLMEDRTSETTYSEEADNAGRTLVGSFSSSLRSTSIASSLDLLEVPSTVAEPTVVESTDAELSSFNPLIEGESTHAGVAEVTESTLPYNSGSELNSQPTFNAIDEPMIEDANRERNSRFRATTPSSVAELVPGKSTEQSLEFTGDYSNLSTGSDFLQSVFSETLMRKYNNDVQKAEVGEYVHEEINTTNINTIPPLVKASSILPIEYTSAAEKNYTAAKVIMHQLPYKKINPDNANFVKESVSFTKNPLFIEVDNVKSSISNANLISQLKSEFSLKSSKVKSPPEMHHALFVNKHLTQLESDTSNTENGTVQHSSKSTIRKSRPEANSTFFVETTLGRLDGDTMNPVESLKAYDQGSSSERRKTFSTDLPSPTDSFTKGTDGVLYRNLEKFSNRAEKCIRVNITCIECTKISPYCHYSHSEKQCRYSSVRHGNNVYECGERYFVKEDYMPLMATLGAAGAVTATMTTYLCVVFYRRCLKKEAIPKEQTEEMREHLSLIREKRLK